MLEIIYQDDWLVAVNKPSGWLVHRSWLDRDEKVVVMQTVRDQIGQHVFTAHRLDRPTSGVLLMGLSSEAGRLLAQQFEQHQIRKRYHAIVRGWLMEEALLDFPGAAIVISHDRWFLDRVATHILAYEDDSQAVFFEGNYTEYEADRKKRLGDAASQPHRVRHKKLA